MGQTPPPPPPPPPPRMFILKELNAAEWVWLARLGRILLATCVCYLSSSSNAIITIIGQLSPPNKINISTANFDSRHLTFSWSPVAPDRPAIHYNILASNCGSYPTSTNHTKVTCTDAPSDDIMCSFAVQTVLCESVMGNVSDTFRVYGHTTMPQERNNMDICTNTAYLATISSLVVALITSVVVLVTAIIIILQRSKAKIKELQTPHREASSAHMEAMYEDPLPSVTAISTKENVAYGHAKTSTAVMQ